MAYQATSSYPQTFITHRANVEDAAAFRQSETARGNGDTTTHDAKNAGRCAEGPERSSPRRAIAEAIEVMERETQELREANRQLTAEVNELRRDNDDLLQQLEQAHRQQLRAECRTAQIERDVERLQSELNDRRCESETALLTIGELEQRLKDANARYDELRSEFQRKEVDWRAAFERKEHEVRRVGVEREALRVRLEQLSASVRQPTGVDIEMMHEVETLKHDRNEMAAARDELARNNGKLAVELQNLATVLAERESELRNERMRHALLTRQFNSLLSENTSLKDKHNVLSVNGAGATQQPTGVAKASHRSPTTAVSSSASASTSKVSSRSRQQTTSARRVESENNGRYANEPAYKYTPADNGVTSSMTMTTTDDIARLTSSCSSSQRRQLPESGSTTMTTGSRAAPKKRPDANHVTNNPQAVAIPSLGGDIESMSVSGGSSDVNDSQVKGSQQSLTSRKQTCNVINSHTSSRETQSMMSDVSVSRLRVTLSRSSSFSAIAAVPNKTVTSPIASADDSQRQLPSLLTVSGNNSHKQWVP